MEQEIKVGDRVVGVGVVDGKNIDGKNGTAKSGGGIRVAVEFDEDVNGWDSNVFGVKKGHGWGCPVANLRRITEDNPAPSLAWSIHITPKGNATHAVFKQGRRVADHASVARYYRDTYDATTGAVWAFLRLPGMTDAARRVLAEMDGADLVEVKAPTLTGDKGKVEQSREAAPKKRGMTLKECKVGMKVKFVDADTHKENPEYYPAVETVGEVVGIEGHIAKVQWPKGSTSEKDRWYARYELLEPADVADEPAPVPQPMYKPGDRVRIVEKWGPGCHQAPDGSMDKWLGKVMTVRGVHKTDGPAMWYKMIEDKREYNGNDTPGWNWCPAAIVGKVGESRKEK